MNNERRAAISVIKESLSDLCSQIEALKDEEQESFDNTPESLQQAERGQQSEEAINALDSAMTSVNDAIESLEGIA